MYIWGHKHREESTSSSTCEFAKYESQPEGAHQMKFPLPTDTFPPLALSSDDTRMLEDAAEEIVKTSIKQYVEHLTVHNSVVDEKRWKKVTQRDDIHLYRAQSNCDLARDQPVRTGCERTIEHLSRTPRPHDNDAQSRLDSRQFGRCDLKTMYIESGIEDWRLLASIIKPSTDDPFRELSIKWTAKGHPPPLTAVMHPRDGVVIESTGIALTPNGERVGYHLYHSVDIPGVRELTKLNIVRVQISICEFFRQRSENCVEIYGRSVLNPMGGVPPVIVVLSASKVAIAVSKYVHCAVMKKLTRLMRSSQQNPSCSDSSTTSSSQSWRRSWHSRPSLSSTLCELCSQSVGSGLLLSFSRPRATQCRICSARVCARCSVEKTMYFPTEMKKQLMRECLTFCTRCMQSVSSANSTKFAVLDALECEGATVDYANALR